MVNAGDVIYASDVAVKACRVTRTTAQAITDNTATAMLFTAEDFDNDGLHSTVTNTSRITIVTAGFYKVGFNGSFESQNYINTQARLRLNGTTEIARVENATTTGNAPTVNVETFDFFDAGDYIEVVVFQDNSVSATRNIEIASNRPLAFYAVRIGS